MSGSALKAASTLPYVLLERDPEPVQGLFDRGNGLKLSLALVSGAVAGTELSGMQGLSVWTSSLLRTSQPSMLFRRTLP